MKKGENRGKGISNVWGIAAATIVGGEDTYTMVVTKRESSLILKDRK